MAVKKETNLPRLCCGLHLVVTLFCLIGLIFQQETTSIVLLQVLENYCEINILVVIIFSAYRHNNKKEIVITNTAVSRISSFFITF